MTVRITAQDEFPHGMTSEKSWNAAPRTALWYGEVIFCTGEETTYNYGYSSDPEPDDPHKHLLPEGAELLEWGVQATGRNAEAADPYAWGWAQQGGDWEIENEDDDS